VTLNWAKVQSTVVPVVMRSFWSVISVGRSRPVVVLKILKFQGNRVKRLNERSLPEPAAAVRPRPPRNDRKLERFHGPHQSQPV